MVSGKVTYVPRVVLREIDDLKIEDKLKKDSEAFKKMVEYARMGRELKRAMTLNFTRLPTRTSNPFQKRKYKKREQ